MTKRITPPAGQPLTAAVEGDQLVVRIGIDALAATVLQGGSWPNDRTISDARAFANALAEGITSALHAFEIFENSIDGVEFRDGDGIEVGDPGPACAALKERIAPILPVHLKDIDGLHRQDAKGRWVLSEAFDVEEIIEDELVREIVAEARALAGRLSEFRDGVLVRATEFRHLLDQQYGVKKGGQKGNLTLSTIDQNEKFEVRINDLIAFGPQLQQAKALIDECLSEWGEGSRPEIRAIVMRAFNVEQEGKVNRGELFMLKKLRFDDRRWKRAMQAIENSIRVEGTKTYVRFTERVGEARGQRTISLDIARA